MLAGIAEAPASARAGLLADRASAWSRGADSRRKALVARAVEALAGIAAPLTFDYSSTVADIVAALAGRGQLRLVVVPESRAVDGGRRYVEAFKALGIPLRVTPDAAIDHAVGLSDCMLIGAESVSADGGVVNTIGSAPFARAAVAAGRPVYGCADLFKVGDTAARDWPARATASLPVPSRCRSGSRHQRAGARDGFPFARRRPPHRARASGPQRGGRGRSCRPGAP